MVCSDISPKTCGEMLPIMKCSHPNSNPLIGTKFLLIQSQIPYSLSVVHMDHCNSKFPLIQMFCRFELIKICYIAGHFQGVQFSWIGNLDCIMCLIFTDMCHDTHCTVHSHAYFVGIIFTVLILVNRQDCCCIYIKWSP